MFVWLKMIWRKSRLDAPSFRYVSIRFNPKLDLTLTSDYQIKFPFKSSYPLSSLCPNFYLYIEFHNWNEFWYKKTFLFSRSSFCLGLLWPSTKNEKRKKFFFFLSKFFFLAKVGREGNYQSPELSFQSSFIKH